MLPGMPQVVINAVRVGGQLTCQHALQHHGVWVFNDPRVHVAVNRDATQLRSAHDPTRRREPRDADVTVHWRRSSTATTRALATVSDALTDYERCAPDEHLAIAVDSALHLGLVGPDHPLVARLTPRGIDGMCESGIETIFWLRMRLHHIPISRQVRFPGIGRVDFLIGERLVVEVDGKSFHDVESSFESDRNRDAHLSTHGFRVLRFSYHQILDDWPLVEAAVLAAVSRGDHLR
ncbi:MAG: endonuclease domain-containing protein [Microbacteriaceae bacterium]|nr:endonuclease domain-containing protein [Microbacteriaceae bacterium]